MRCSVCPEDKLHWDLVADGHVCKEETFMEIKKVLAGWSKICPGCNIGRKYPDSFIGKKVRNHWEKGCISHNAYVDMYGSEESSPKKENEKSNHK